MTNTQTGDIIQDQVGWFYRVNSDGSMDRLSGNRPPTGRTITLVRDGQPTGQGDSLATRCALVMNRRYAA